MSQQPPIIDPELRQLFIEEAEQKSGEISRGIAEWHNQPDSLDRMVWLQMRFSEYSGMAKTIGLQRSGQNCALVVDELTQVIGGARDAEDSLPALFDNALESIDYALEYLHGDDVAPELIFEADSLSEPTVADMLPTLDFPDVGKQAKTSSDAPPPQPTATLAVEQAPPKDIEASLLEIFFDEADELLAAAEEALKHWLGDHDKAESGKVLKRVFHTLKGNARLTNMLVLGDYLHDAESEIETLLDGPDNPALAAQTCAKVDTLQSAMTALRNGETASLGGASGSRSGRPPANPNIPEAEAETSDMGPSNSEPAPAARQFIRVKTEILESLRLRASEMNALRNQIQQISTALQTEQRLNVHTVDESVNQLRGARFALERLIERLPNQLAAELTDLQLDSQMALQVLEDLLLRLHRQSDRSIDLTAHIERALLGQNKAGFSLREDIQNTRLVPFSDYSNRLQRIVRQTCNALNSDDSKPAIKADLIIEGADAELDRQMIERLLPVLEHMLRNAVVHGIENEATRREQGKPTTGNIRLVVRKTRGKLEVDLRDDGRGLDLETIRERAVTLGLIQAEEEVSQRRLERMIFHPGLSVATQLDQLAGRGIGMDVVEHTVHELGGSIDLNSKPQKGTRFTLRMPMGESALNAIIVRIADEIYAVPQQDIRHVQRLDNQTLSRGYQDNKPIAWNGEGWTIRSLGHWLGLGEGSLPGLNKSLPALLIAADQDNYAVVVDHCGDSAEYSLETLPAPVTGILGVSAAIILEDGQIAPVLDLPALCKSGIQYQRKALRLLEPDATIRYPVMLIEDSALWRRQVSSGLKRYPLDVTVCDDGQEALQRIDKAAPRLLILDLEMPRMDGLEFLRRLRRHPKYSEVPVIMFSTTTGMTQRNRARQLGAKAWVNKSGNMRPLLTEIDRQLGTHFAAHAAEPDAG